MKLSCAGRSILFSLLVSLLMWSPEVYSQPTSTAKKDTLMWFTGTWVSKTVFKADSNYVTGGPASAKVTMNPDGSPFIQSPDVQQFNQKIDQWSSAADAELNSLKQQISSEGLGQYRLYTFTKEEIDSVKAWLQKLKLPESPPSASPSSQFTSNLLSYCQSTHPDYDAVMQFYQAHKGIKNEHYDYPDPPRADYFNCWGCQHDAQKTFRAACADYDSTFFLPESDLLKKAQAILKEIYLVGQGYGAPEPGPDMKESIDNLFHWNKNDHSKNGPCAYLNYVDLTDAVAFFARRMMGKADQLLHDVDHNKDYNAFIPAVEVKLKAYRQGEILGITDNAKSLFTDCSQLEQKLLNKLTDNLLTQHDWSYLGTIPLMCQIGAVIGSLGGGGNDQLIQQIINSTHFKLSLEMNVSLNFQNHGTQTTYLKGDAKMVAELDSLKCIRFVLSKAENDVMTMHLMENSMSLQQCSPSYAGTYTYTTALPVLNVDFCKGKADTLTLARFSPKPESAGIWNNPCGGPPVNSGINGIDGYFIDPNRVMGQAQVIKSNSGAHTQQMQDMVAQLKQQAAALKQQFTGGSVSGMNSPSTATSIKNMMDLANTAMNSQITQLSRMIFQVNVTNKQPTLINQVIHITDVNTNPQVTQMVKYGTLTIQLKNTQN